MSTPAQMYTYELNGVKALVPGAPWVVDKTLKLASGVDPTTVKAGMVVSITGGTSLNPDSRTWQLGTGTSGIQNAPMPFLLFQNGTDFDVVGDDGNFTGATLTGTTQGRLTAFCCNMGAEVETTAYNTGTSFLTGDLLISNSSGVIQKATGTGPLRQTILGVVSDGTVYSDHSRSITLLRFHTCFWQSYIP